MNNILTNSSRTNWNGLEAAIESDGKKKFYSHEFKRIF